MKPVKNKSILIDNQNIIPKDYYLYDTESYDVIATIFGYDQKELIDNYSRYNFSGKNYKLHYHVSHIGSVLHSLTVYKHK